MKLEVLLVLAGLLMFVVFGALRGLKQGKAEDTQHFQVLRNLGCLMAIIGLSILIVRSLMSFG